MKKAKLAGIAMLVWIGGISSTKAEEVTFYVGQTNPDWAFVITAKGRAVIGDSLVYTTYDDLRITNNPKHNIPKQIRTISLGFGYLTEDGRWDVKHVQGGQLATDITLQPGETTTLENVDSVLKLEGEPAENYWIVVTVEMGNRSTVYAHSRRDIFE